MTNDNEIKRAVDKIINNKETENLKIILLTATPMKNTLLDIVPLMNFILPTNRKLEKKMLVENPNVAVDRYILTNNWYEVLRDRIGNHISFLKTNSDTFPNVEYMGENLSEDSEFKIFKCKMNSFQTEAYRYVQNQSDLNKDKMANAFSKNLQAIQMFSFPIFKPKKKKIEFTHMMVKMLNNFEEIKNQNKLKDFYSVLGDRLVFRKFQITLLNLARYRISRYWMEKS